jgi:hypothetical protein
MKQIHSMVANVVFEAIKEKDLPWHATVFV